MSVPTAVPIALEKMTACSGASFPILVHCPDSLNESYSEGPSVSPPPSLMDSWWTSAGRA